MFHNSIAVDLASYPSINHAENSQQHRLPDAADLRQMCIITKSDLNRIHENLNRRQRDKDAIEQELARKRELAERSAQITKNWPNTIAVSTRDRIRTNKCHSKNHFRAQGNEN